MSDQKQNLPVEQSMELQQRFEQLSLREMGLQETDYADVMTARKELADMNPTAVAEYGKGIATRTSVYTDELLGMVKNKDLDATGQKLNEVVQVAQQLNTSSILNKSKNSGFLGGLLNKFKGAKQSFDQNFNSTKEQIDTLVKEIESSQNGLKTRVGTLDKMFDGVQDEYKQLGIYAAAGKLKQQEIQQEITALTNKSKISRQGKKFMT